MYTLQRKLFTMIEGASPTAIKFGLGGAMAVTALAAPSAAMADTSKTGGVATDACDSSTRNVIDLIQSVIGWAMALAGILVVVLYVFAGIEWMAAGGNMQKVQKAQNRIKNATIGLIIIAVAFLVRNVILDLVSGGAKTQNNVDNLEACDE